MNHLTNRRRSDGTPLDGWHGISGLCDGSSWRCITKRDRLSWFDLTRFRTTVRVSKQEQVMFESSSKSRKRELEWMTDDLAMSSRYLKQLMKMIWKVAMVILRGGTRIYKTEAERSARAGTYFGMRDAR